MNITDINFAIDILSHPQEGDESDIKEALKVAIESLKAWKEVLKEESKTDAFDKMRAEIDGKHRVILKDTPKDDWAVKWNDCVDEVLEVVDKYKAEEMTSKEADRGV